MSTSSAYRSLSNEQKDVLRKKSIAAEKTPEEWLSFLQPIAAYDRKRDKASIWAVRLAIGGGLLMVFSLLALGFAGLITIVGWPFFLGALILILETLKYKRLKRLDIEANLEKLVFPLLHILKEELRPSKKLQLQLNLHALEQAELMKELQPKNKKTYPRVVTQFFRKRWLSGATQLADGTALRLQIIDLVQKTKKTKRNPRGKIKTKLKYKQKSLLSLTLGFRTDAYALKTTQLRMPTDGKTAIKTRDNRHWVKMRRRVKFPPRSTIEPDSIPLDDCVGTIVAAFQQVTRIRKAQ